MEMGKGHGRRVGRVGSYFGSDADGAKGSSSAKRNS